MKRFLVLTIGVLGLSACVTMDNGQSAQVTQGTITNASMLSKSSNCAQLSNTIHQMDQIIVANSSAAPSSNSSGSQYSGTKSTINQHLYQNQAWRENQGIASDLMKAFTGNGTSNANSQLQTQQLRDAQSEKNRLVGVFQNKGCS